MSSSPPTEVGRAGTLQRQLVVRITLIVTAVAIVLAGISTFLVGRILTANLDQQLRYAVFASDERPDGPGTGGPGMGGPGGRDELRSGGLPQGSISVVVVGEQTRGMVVGDHGMQQASDAQIAALLALPRDGRVRPLEINSDGDYRAVAVADADKVLAAAAPVAVTRAVLARMIGIELALIALAAGAAALVSSVVVRASLRPLNRLAATAGAVAELPLAAGEVELGVRVPTAAADPRGEVGQVGAAFNKMLDHVEASLQARHASESRGRQFVADASHELRNPLAAIRGYAELTRRDRDQLPTDTVFALGRIESESLRMSRLVEQMLLLARLDNEPQLLRAEVDIAELALNAVADARAASPAHHWRVELPDEPVPVLGDEHQLHQVLVNLLGNARKHTPPGTTVTTTVTREADQIRIEVLDDGPGIAPELLDSVFERFARADAARSHDQEGSTGLGLAIVAAVARAHGGRVEVDSRLASDDQPGFSRFTVWLPARGWDSASPRS